MKTIHKEMTVNIGTLEAHGEYVTYLHLDDEDIRIRLIVKKEYIPQSGTVSLLCGKNEIKQ